MKKFEVKKQMRKYYTLIILFAGLWLAGCSKDEPVPPPVDNDPKTFILYGNIGEYYFSNNVRAAGRAVAAGALIKGQRVIVCHEKQNSQGVITQNVIYELVRDKKAAEGYRRDTLEVYEGDDTRSTLDPDDMKYLLEEIRAMAPANHYGLALGSHGMGWVPKESFPVSAYRLQAKASQFPELWAPIDENPTTRYLGHSDRNGNNYRVDIADFAAAMGSMEWDFVLFDVCFMGSVEAVYEMRRIAPYLIVSPAEVLIEGFPYENIVKVLFKDWTDLKGVCAAYMDFYKNSYATVSLVDTGELERLAGTVNAIYKSGYNDVDPTAAVIQYFEGMSNHVFYDLDDYMRHLAKNTHYYAQFYDQLQKTLPYTNHTPYFYSAWASGKIRIYHYSGLTAFIPYAGKEDLRPGYEQTAWYKDVHK